MVGWGLVLKGEAGTQESKAGLGPGQELKPQKALPAPEAGK